MIGLVFRREMRALAAAPRFRVVGLLTLLLLVLGGLTSASRYRTELEVHRRTLAAQREALAGIPLDRMAELPIAALKRPWKLGFLVEGGQKTSPNCEVQRLAPTADPLIRRSHTVDSRLPAPIGLDWFFVVRVVLSIGAFVLCHDGICGERVSRNLHLVLSHPVPRWQFLVGKASAAWAALGGVFLLGALANLSILALSGMRFNHQESAKIAAAVLLSLMALVLFVSVALLVSAVVRRPATGLNLLALLWVTSVFVLPAGGASVARILLPVLSEGEIDRRLAASVDQMQREFPGVWGSWRRPDAAARDDYAWERVSARAQNRGFELRRAVHRAVLDRKLAQAELARRVAALSPTSLIQRIAEDLVGSGIARERAFFAQVREFRTEMAAAVRALDAADPQSPHILFFPHFMSKRPVDPAAIPAFTLEEVPLRRGLAAAVPDLAVLAGLTALVAVTGCLRMSLYPLGARP